MLLLFYRIIVLYAIQKIIKIPLVVFELERRGQVFGHVAEYRKRVGQLDSAGGFCAVVFVVGQAFKLKVRGDIVRAEISANTVYDLYHAALGVALKALARQKAVRHSVAVVLVERLVERGNNIVRRVFRAACVPDTKSETGFDSPVMRGSTNAMNAAASSPMTTTAITTITTTFLVDVGFDLGFETGSKSSALDSNPSSTAAGKGLPRCDRIARRGFLQRHALGVLGIDCIGTGRRHSLS